MAAWDDINLDEMTFSQEEDMYTYPCPCGDDFFITVDDLLGAEDLAPCPSCSLLIRVIYDPEEFLESIELLMENESDGDQGEEAGDEQQEQVAICAAKEESKPGIPEEYPENNAGDTDNATYQNSAEAVATELEKLEIGADGEKRDVDLVDP
mmetsp:Transcript_16215/g.31394  ORF Transcript_16215/g.31394 Transcript_16215/m.31394 type:complete len:152 (+) Transcript_16215:65-520(+)